MIPSIVVFASPSVPLSFLFPTLSAEHTSPVSSSPSSFNPPAEFLSHSSLDPSPPLSTESPAVSSPPLSVESPTVSSPPPSLPLAHPPVRFTYHRRDPAEPPSRPVISDTSPTTDPAPEVHSHTYSLHDRSTLHPPVRYASTSTSVSDVFEPGTYREAVRLPEWRTAMQRSLKL
ncbi:leucine-rich repeat extensin-like protein 5 [Dioscorea cayenensis subsp. rotundata]|uniref:Leucine-rich repeat extensin-like protein 5 n=1 Tax=Dioscorea cayennensis subsp. rotundata TaxID=55577 RepID=A0AB40CB23_DIOCR|nr:leucine-rich repeat extensin-like protein 5 [Dioscorea cayenensis subsp. rotundata]